MKCNIRIKTNCIEFLSPFDKKDVSFTIWEEEYDDVIKAIKQSQEYKREEEILNKKYKWVKK